MFGIDTAKRPSTWLASSAKVPSQEPVLLSSTFPFPFALLLMFCLCVMQSVHHPLVVIDVATTAGAKEARMLLKATQPLTGAAGKDTLLTSALEPGTLVLNNMHQVTLYSISKYLQ
jgi:hypothetical protein